MEGYRARVGIALSIGGLAAFCAAPNLASAAGGLSGVTQADIPMFLTAGREEPETDALLAGRRRSRSRARSRSRSLRQHKKALRSQSLDKRDLELTTETKLRSQSLDKLTTETKAAMQKGYENGIEQMRTAYQDAIRAAANPLQDAPFRIQTGRDVDGLVSTMGRIAGGIHKDRLNGWRGLMAELKSVADGVQAEGIEDPTERRILTFCRMYGRLRMLQEALTKLDSTYMNSIKGLPTLDSVRYGFPFDLPPGAAVNIFEAVKSLYATDRTPASIALLDDWLTNTSVHERRSVPAALQRVVCSTATLDSGMRGDFKLRHLLYATVFMLRELDRQHPEVWRTSSQDSSHVNVWLGDIVP